MIYKSLYSFCILLICASVIGLNCERKGRKLKENSLYADYEIHRTENLPSDQQISTFLFKGETQTFTYLSRLNNLPLSLTLISCTSPIYWLVKLRPAGPTNSSNIIYNTEYKINNFTSSNLQTAHLTSIKGTYVIQITALERDSYVHVYVSTEAGGPQAFQNLQTKSVLKLMKRRQQKKLSIRWDQSLVDPQVTDYCLVINTQHHYLTYCSAYGAKYGVSPPKSRNKLTADSQTIITWDRNIKNSLSEPLINCVGSRTQFTFTHLQLNHGYYFDLFAFNKQSNLTYLYGSSFMIFNKRTKPIRLRDNKLSYANLKKLDGKVVFQYKTGQLLSDSLKIHIMPCGGSVDIYISSKGKIITSRKNIESYGFLMIPNLKAGLRYSIKILSTNNEELRKTSGIEILATAKPSSKSFLPVMPIETTLQEYVSLRECDSVTVGWLASPGQRVVRYCWVIREQQLNDLQSYRIPNQCGLENRMKKSADFKAKYCRDIKQENQNVITQKIEHLASGKHYVVQVTVKKPKGKTLSYDLLQVHTKPSCKTLNTIS